MAVSVRGEVCGGVLILPHSGLGSSITSALQVCLKKHQAGMLHELVSLSDTLRPNQLGSIWFCFFKRQLVSKEDGCRSAQREERREREKADVRRQRIRLQGSQQEKTGRMSYSLIETSH